METEFHKSARGYQLFIDGQHKKTFACKYLVAMEKNLDQIDFNKKRLSASEKEILDKWSFKPIYQSFMDLLKKKEPLVYDLIKNASVNGVRLVEGKTGNRYEICYDNNIKLKISKQIFSKYPVKLETAFLNY